MNTPRQPRAAQTVPARAIPAQAALLLHPIRARLLSSFARQTRTTRDLAQMHPDLPQATLYRHLKLLLDGGVLEVVREERVGGTIQRHYRVRDGQSGLSQEQMRDFTPQDYLATFEAYVAGLLERYSAFLKGDSGAQADSPQGGASFQRASLYLTDEDFRQFQQEIMACFERAAQRSQPGGRGYTLAICAIPDPPGQKA